MSQFRTVLCAVLMFCTWNDALLGQANVPQYRGDYGLLAGTLPPPGAYITGLYNNYQSTEVVGAGGVILPGFTPGYNTVGLQLTYSFPGTAILGAHAASTIIVPSTDIALETPITQFTTQYGFGDMFLQPVKLGWSIPAADFVVGSGVWMPTGRYNPNQLARNTGLGVWGWEQQLGSTLYVGTSRRASISGLFSYETSTTKRGTDRKPGQLATIEGGAGFAFLPGVGLTPGIGQIGLVYYAQWKTSADRNFHLPAEFNALDRRFGIGPEVTIPFPLNAFTGIATFRYYFEGHNRVAPQGDSFWVFLSFYHPHKKK
jgi:hypothetical protein